MICSANEVGAMLKKAAVGLGFPVGLAADVAAAGVWLSTQGLDGVEAVLAGIGKGFVPDFGWDADGPVIHLCEAAIGRCGVSLFELLATGEIEVAVVEDADSPLLLIGLAGVVARATGVGFELSAGIGSPIAVTANAVRSPEELGGSLTGRLIRIVAADGAGGEALADTAPIVGIEVAEPQWSLVSELAARTNVPATDLSRRAGAGALLDDND